MTVSREFCRHYPPGGMGDNTHCRAGIDMRTTRAPGAGAARFPCYDPDVAHLCSKHEAYTKEEIDEDNLEIAAVITAFADLLARKSETCLGCGGHIETMVESGRCVYAQPCGCRLFQGSVPDAWKRDP